MSSTADSTAHPSDNSNWRAVPPHMATSATTSQFVSARTQAGDNPAGVSTDTDPPIIPLTRGTHSPEMGPSVSSGSPTPGTSSPSAPTGLTARVVGAPDGTYYLVHKATGSRMDVIDDDNIIVPEELSRTLPDQPQESEHTDPLPSSESDLPDTLGSEAAGSIPHPVRSADAKITDFIADVGPDALTRDQMNTLNQIRGAIATGRDRLFATTAMALDHQHETTHSHATLVQFRDEVAAQFAVLHEEIHKRNDQFNNCISDNVKVLRELGVSEMVLGKILSTAAHIRADKLRHPHLPEPAPLGRVNLDPELVANANAALPPRRRGETNEDFDKRADAVMARKSKASAAFVIPEDDDRYEPTRRENPGYTARFEDVGSISTGPRRRAGYQPLSSSRSVIHGGNSLSHTGYLTANESGEPFGDIFEEFRLETDESISRIIDRQLGTELVLPSKVKPPKINTPPQFTGTDDHLGFLRWLEKLVSWMRTMFYGGPEVDEYRVTVLKNLLDGVALEWYIDFVENYHVGPDMPRDFTSILCALHRRFITTATAHHALRDFEIVRYKAEDGPLKLMDDLETCSRRMREPMPGVIIRQRFMKLIPAELHDDLITLRGISPTYLSIHQMRTHANQLWDALKTARGSRLRNSPAVRPEVNSNSKATPFVKRPSAPADGKTRPIPSQPTSQPLLSRPPATRVPGTGPHADKTCFKCGVLGHIGSDPICSKYNEQPSFRERPRMGAQRVLDSYAAEDEELLLETDEQFVPDNWGGDQYESDSDERIPTESTDLIELTDTLETENARLATRRLLPPAADLMAALPRALRPYNGLGNTAHEDFLRLAAHRDQEGLRAFSVAEERRITDELRATRHYVDDPVQSFAERALVFKARHGDGLWPRSIAKEWEALQRLQLAEHIRDVRLRTSLAPLALYPEPSSLELALMDTGDLRIAMTRLTRRLGELDGLYRNLADLNRMGREEVIKSRRGLNDSSHQNASTREIIETTLEMLQSTVHYTARFLGRVDERQRESDEFHARLRYEHSVRTELRDHIVGPVAAPATSIPHSPVIISDDEEDPNSEGASEDETAPPSVGSTPPPSYPGSPNVSNEADAEGVPSDSELWDSLSTPDSELIAGSPALSDPAPSSSAQLRAMRIVEVLDDAPRTLPALTEGSSLLVPEFHFTTIGESSPEIIARIDAAVDRTHRAEVARAQYEAVWATRPEPERREAMIRAASPRENTPEGRPEFPLPEADEADSLPDLDRAEYETGVHWAVALDAAIRTHNAYASPDGRSPADQLYQTQLPDESTSDEEAQEVEEECLASDDSEDPDQSADYVIVNHHRPAPEPSPEDVCILRSLVMLTDSEAEHYLTYVDCHGNLYVRTQALPDNHFLNPHFRSAHQAAMQEAINERAEELHVRPELARPTVSWAEGTGNQLRDRRGYRDISPHLLPGEVFHDRLASHDPDQDREQADPGFRVQVLAQHVEHLSNVNRREIHELDQPSRLRKDITCLSAQLDIAGTPAYMLFDSGSNIDSITPEFARATHCKNIKLSEQVTLQLGCVGSRSKINYGTRPSVNFGGIRGHVYFDQANLDRYDGIIGTPFMNKHGLVLDFAAREIRFPNGRVVKALSTLEEASLLATRNAEASHRATASST
ncbi:hypothetical protein DFH09DRAFT_1341621 [Mycena vulgaris]|nr:hypothetical protein DFH09DRAFT_1341621 [Mycena vulgaris]